MQHQNGGSIGVAHQRSQQLAGLCMVVAGLAAAEGMGEGVQALDGAGDQILIVGNDLLAMSLTQPTVGMIQISLRMAARPSLRRKPIKVSGSTLGRGARSGAGL